MYYPEYPIKTSQKCPPLPSDHPSQNVFLTWQGTKILVKLGVGLGNVTAASE